MSFEVVRKIHEFADFDCEIIGRDVLRRELHKFADKVDDTIDAIIAHYNRRIAKQAGVMAETAERNVKQKEINKELVDENDALLAKTKVAEKICEREISKCRKIAERCIDCHDGEDVDCPYLGEPCGCNSPKYGEFPTETECAPFVEILAAIRKQGGAE